MSLTPRPGRFTPGKEIQYPLYRRFGGLQSQSRWVRKICPPPGFEPRTVQPVASRYTVYVIPGFFLFERLASNFSKANLPRYCKFVVYKFSSDWKINSDYREQVTLFTNPWRILYKRRNQPQETTCRWFIFSGTRRGVFWVSGFRCYERTILPLSSRSSRVLFELRDSEEEGTAILRNLRNYWPDCTVLYHR